METSGHPGDCNASAAGDGDMRQKLIQRFVEYNGGRFEEIMDKLGAGDIKSAHRLAHTLKSNAGQLELDALRQAAETVESRLKSGVNSVTPEQSEALKTELDRAIAKLSPLVREPVRLEPAQPIDRADALGLLERAELLLEDYDTDCMELIDRLRLIPGSEVLVKRMEDFAYAEALSAVLELKGRL